MKKDTCEACGTEVLEKAVFCYSCGNQLKCKSCHEVLVPGGQHCIACGASVDSPVEKSSAVPFNKIKFRENKNERFYEIEFTNDVGKEIKEVVADLLKNKMGGDTDQTLVIPEKPVAEEISHSGKGNQGDLPDKPALPEDIVIPGELAPKIQVTDYPHLNDLEIKLDARENEWLLLYAFYGSGYGANTFNKEMVWQKYKEKRLTETRFKSLGTNWKSLFKKYICTVKENEFKFTAQGLVKVNELLQTAINGNKNSARAPRKTLNFTNSSNNSVRSLPVSRKIAANSIVSDEFDVYRDEYKVSLEEFFNRKKPGSGNPNRIITIAYYITKINHQEYFTEGNIDFAFRILKLSGKPVHLKQVIINLKNTRIWFQKVVDGGTSGWRLTRQGEIYVEEKLPGSS